MRKTLILLLVAIFFYCKPKECTSKGSDKLVEEKKEFSYEGSITLELPIAYLTSLSGVLFNFMDKEEVFYFTSYSTEKRIVFVDRNSTILNEIDLTNLASHFNRLRNVMIADENNIYLLSDENVIYHINDESVILKEFELNALLPEEYRMNSYNFHNAKIVSDNQFIIVQPYWSSSLTVNKESLKLLYLDNKVNQAIESVRKEYQKTPFGFKLDLKEQRLLAIYDKFNIDLYEEDEYVFPALFPVYGCLNNKLFIGSKFSNNIFTVNLKDGKLIRKKEFNTSIEIDNSPIKLNYKDSIYSPTLFRTQIIDSKSWNYISNINSQPSEKKVFIVVRLNSNNFEKNLKLSDKIVYLLNEQLEIEIEFKLKESNHYTTLWPSLNGFYMIKYIKNDPNYNPKIVKLSHYTY
ncbi:MAG: hypothetical protein CMO34_05685 [Verrucomicrobia bacterium]|mgnify:CR=1 FL=1|nr:hypothetical protein [Verrucomicrobiota bacterium]